MDRPFASFRRIFGETDHRFALAAVIALCIAIGLLIGTYVAVLAPVYATAVMLALAIGVLMLRDTQWGFIALIGTICLLPFGSLPFKFVLTPTVLDIAILAIYFVWIVRIAARKNGGFIRTQLGLPILVFLLLACASFIAGLGHASLDQYTVRHFAEVLLSVGLFFVVVNCVQTRAKLLTLTRVLIVAGFAAAVIGVVLYFLPGETSIRLLSSLGRLGYPTGPGVLRYIDDDPSLALRAISTSTDPNVLGGLLILVTTLTASQFFAPKPLLRRWLVALMLLIDVLCLYLTYSRGSMLGLALGLGVLALVKYRRLIPIMIVGTVLLFLLPQTHAYIQRFIQGFEKADLATQMRLGEYKDAFTLIGRHPWIGVGFVGTPETSLYIGVSSVYLLMAEEMGLIGLGVFLIILTLFFWHVSRAWPRARRDPDLEGVILGLTASVAGVLVGGVLDHYFFNLDFPHSVAVFWLYLGLATAAVRLVEHGPAATAESSRARSCPEVRSVI